MIHPNLAHLIQFCDQELEDCLVAVEEIWSSEERVRYNPTGSETYKEESANLYTEYRINTKQFMKFSCRERLFFWKIIRLATHWHESPIVRYIRYDLENHKRFFENSEEYSYLSELSESQFDYYLDCELTQHPDRWYGQWFQTYHHSGESFTIATVLNEILMPHPVYIEKQKPLRVQRHRGYRDHGSLGSEISKTAKQQSSDWSIRKKEEERIRKKQDLIQLCLGLDGWI